MFHSCWTGQLESEVSAKTRMLSARDAELLTIKEEVLLTTGICDHFNHSTLLFLYYFP